MEIRYSEADHRKLELVKPLWEHLRDHHASKSKHFSDQILSNTFEIRSRALLQKANQGQLKIILATETKTRKLIGYCISSIDHGNQGEIDSIYILDEFRGKGVGDTLMKRTLDWFKEHSIQDISMSVMFGNEKALPFYERYGFYPRTYVMKKGNEIRP